MFLNFFSLPQQVQANVTQVKLVPFTCVSLYKTGWRPDVRAPAQRARTAPLFLLLSF